MQSVTDPAGLCGDDESIRSRLVVTDWQVPCQPTPSLQLDDTLIPLLTASNHTQNTHTTVQRPFVGAPVPEETFIFTGRMFLLTPNQQCQSTEGI